jgi:hypothetical protein
MRSPLLNKSFFWQSLSMIGIEEETVLPYSLIQIGALFSGIPSF